MPSSKFSIQGVIGLRDMVTAPMRAAKTAVAGFSRSFVAQIRQANFSLKSLNRGVDTVVQKLGLAKAAQFGMMALGIGAGYAAREFVRFDDAIVGASAKFKDMSSMSKEMKNKTLEGLRLKAREIGRDTQFSAAEAAQGLDFLAMAGFTSAQAMVMIKGVTNLATVANTDFATATDIASDAIGAFGLMVDDTAQLQINFNRVQDVMAKTTTETNTDLQTLFEAVKFGAPAFTAAGQSMETFNAIAGRMASSGIKGTNAGTALRAGIIRLVNPPKEAAGALRALNIQTTDSAGNMRNMIDILGDIETSTKQMSGAQRAAMISTIFGKNAFSAYAAVINEGVQNSRALEQTLLKSGGSAEEMAATIRESLGNQLKILASTATEMGFKFLEAFEKDGRGGIKSLTEAIKNFDVKPVVRGFKVFFGVLKIGLAIIKAIVPFFPLMIGFYVGLKAAVLAAGIAQEFFNVALKGSTIGIIITAVMLLVAAIIYLIVHWDKVVTAMKGAWQWTVNLAGVIWNALISGIKAVIGFFQEWGSSILFLSGPFGIIINIITALMSRWGEVVAAFENGGLIGAIKQIGIIILQAILSPIQKVLELMSRIPGVGNIAAGINKQIATLQTNLTAAAPAQTTQGFYQSPASNQTASGQRTVVQNGRVDVNIGGPGAGNADVSRTGTQPQGLTVNMGAQ